MLICVYGQDGAHHPLAYCTRSAYNSVGVGGDPQCRVALQENERHLLDLYLGTCHRREHDTFKSHHKVE